MENNILILVSGIVSLISFFIFIFAREEKTQTTALFIFICFSVLISIKSEKKNMVFGEGPRTVQGMSK
jgi:hypothetical protein